MLNDKFWSEYFTVYDNLNHLIPYEELMEYILGLADIMPGNRVLDVGSGTGNLSIMATRRGANTVSVDNSRAGMLIHKMKSENERIVYHDITEKFPFPDNYFDVVISNNVLYTIPQKFREEIFKELYRISKINGKIIISNISIKFRPTIIYIDHIKKSYVRFGLFSTLLTILRLTVPTLKIFYYNYLISKENKTGGYNFFNSNEQRKYLMGAGYKDVSKDIYVYSGQAILNYATKRKNE